MKESGGTIQLEKGGEDMIERVMIEKVMMNQAFTIM